MLVAELVVALGVMWFFISVVDAARESNQDDDRSTKQSDAALAAGIAAEELRKGNAITDVTIRRNLDGRDDDVSIRKIYR